MAKHTSTTSKRWSNAVLLVLSLATTVPCLAAQTTPALNHVPDPILDDTADTLTDAEIGSVGCLVASATMGGSMLYLMGGIGTALALMAPPLHPTVVLEGSAAVAFVLSSACYVGVAMAPLAVSAYNTISDQLTQSSSPPLFAPGELLAIGEGATVPQQPYPNGQQPYAGSPPATSNTTSAPAVR